MSNTRTARIRAIDNLRSSDIAPDKPVSKKDGSTLILQILLLLCLCVFLGSVLYAGSALAKYYTADSLYEDIWDSYLGNAANPLPSPANPYGTALAIPNFVDILHMADADKDNIGGGGITPVSPNLLRMRRILAALRLQNEDTYGWLSVAGTKIDYPVVQTTDNDYYLNHAFTGVFLEAGAIYTDYRNSGVPTENRNTIIYGHNMKNGIMFHALEDYFDGTGDYLRAHQDIVLATDSGIYTYRIFALYKADATENYIRTAFSTNQQFLSFAQGLAQRTDDVYRRLCDAPTIDDTILTLSTCTNNVTTDERYAIHARLVSVEK